MRPLLALAMVVMVMTISSCDQNDQLSSGTRVVGPFDFVGEVRAVEFGPGWAMLPADVALATGGPAGDVVLGPQVMVTSDGRRLRVPTDTPGGNSCLLLIHPSKVTAITGDANATLEDVPRWETNRTWSVPCVVAGQLTDGDEVAWYAVLPVEEYEGALLADIGYVDGQPTDSILTTRSGYQAPTAVTETDCGLPIGATAGTKALMDWTTGQVTALVCLFDG